MAGTTTRLGGALVCGLLGAAAVTAVATVPVRLEPGAAGWSHVVWGATPDGTVDRTGLIRIPGLDRRLAARLLVQAEAVRGGTASVGLSVDGGAFVWASADGVGYWSLPASNAPGTQVRIATVADRPVRLRRLEVQGSSVSSSLPALLVLVAVTGLVLALARRDRPLHGIALGLVMAGACGLACVPLFLLFRLPALEPLVRLAFPFLLLTAGTTLGLRRDDRRRFALAVALVMAGVFGAWVRAYFIPSAGSWDTDYWKACTRRVVSQGVTRAYGDPEPLSIDRLLARAAGREPLWEAEGFGRTFVVDQPPGIMVLWRWSSHWVQARTDLRGDEAENAAAKLPAVLGDLLSVGLLLLAFPGRRGLTLAAIFWALPISWLSSAVLGFFDGAHAPLTVAALLAAGSGHAVLAGLLLASAGLVKSTAVMVAPAVAVALYAARRPLRPAVVAGLALVAFALLPFALDHTLPTAAVHMFRIFFQKRLSGGFANPWWIASHLISLGESGRTAVDRIPFVHVQSIRFPVNALGLALFGTVAVYVARLHRRFPGRSPAALAGAVLILTYAMVAVGAHENHPHAFVLALLATGLASGRIRWLSAILLLDYVLNLLALSGLGRFYGPRYMPLDRLTSLAAGFRMAPGFDVTLVLSVVNLIAYGVLLAALRGEMEKAAALDRATDEAEATGR